MEFFIQTTNNYFALSKMEIKSIYKSKFNIQGATTHCFALSNDINKTCDKRMTKLTEICKSSLYVVVKTYEEAISKQTLHFWIVYIRGTIFAF